MWWRYKILDSPGVRCDITSYMIKILNILYAFWYVVNMKYLVYMVYYAWWDVWCDLATYDAH